MITIQEHLIVNKPTTGALPFFNGTSGMWRKVRTGILAEQKALMKVGHPSKKKEDNIPAACLSLETEKI